MWKSLICVLIAGVYTATIEREDCVFLLWWGGYDYVNLMKTSKIIMTFSEKNTIFMHISFVTVVCGVVKSYVIGHNKADLLPETMYVV